MSARRAAMIAGACAVLGAWSAEARAELHRLAFRGLVGDIPTPLAGSPTWSGITVGDPMLISCVVEAPSEIWAPEDLDAARLISVSMVIGGRLESTDGAGSTIRAILEEGIAPANAAGVRMIELDLVLPSGVRVLVTYEGGAAPADWVIGDTDGQLRFTTRGGSASLERRLSIERDALADSIIPAVGLRRIIYVRQPIASPVPSGALALLAPGLLAAWRRRRPVT